MSSCSTMDILPGTSSITGNRPNAREMDRTEAREHVSVFDWQCTVVLISELYTLELVVLSIYVFLNRLWCSVKICSLPVLSRSLNVSCFDYFLYSFPIELEEMVCRDRNEYSGQRWWRKFQPQCITASHNWHSSLSFSNSPHISVSPSTHISVFPSSSSLITSQMC